jgi:hypothetical protein
MSVVSSSVAARGHVLSHGGVLLRTRRPVRRERSESGLPAAGCRRKAMAGGRWWVADLGLAPGACTRRPEPSYYSTTSARHCPRRAHAQLRLTK